MDWRWTDSLGVGLRGHGLPGRTTDWARAAERAGLGSLWVIEDYFLPGAYALAGAAAAVTERIEGRRVAAAGAARKVELRLLGVTVRTPIALMTSLDSRTLLAAHPESTREGPDYFGGSAPPSCTSQTNGVKGDRRVFSRASRIRLSPRLAPWARSVSKKRV